MPRPKRVGVGPPKTRSRAGCWPCKTRKIKCGEEKPCCANCRAQKDTCDYNIRLNWDVTNSRTKSAGWRQQGSSLPNTPSSIIFPSPDIFSGRNTPASTSTSTSTTTTTTTITTATAPAPAPEPVTLQNSSSHFRTNSNSSGPRPPSFSAINVLRHSDSSTALPKHRDKRPRLSGPSNSLPLSATSSAASPPLVAYPLTSPLNGGPPLFDSDEDDYDQNETTPTKVNQKDVPGRIEFKAIPCQSYGYDSGLVDYDDKNDDSHTLANSPHLEQGEGTFDSITIDFDNYYAKPVRVAIPLSLHPLPDTLNHNQMNLLYFHHFLNHTARILTPHDCPANPFRTVLPQMAVADPDLLRLLLAYSACHRASLVKQEIPSKRIAAWLSGVFGSISSRLNKERTHTEQNYLVASTILLSSLDIISEASIAIGATFPWLKFLESARAAIVSRPAMRSPHFDNDSFFLCRWFGYLDVIGTLSTPAKAPVENQKFTIAPVAMNQYWVDNPDDPPDIIDCLLGCTVSGMKLLGQVAQLVKECENNRLDPQRRIRRSWVLSPSLQDRADTLLSQLRDSLQQPVKTCPHGQRLSPTMMSDSHRRNRSHQQQASRREHQDLAELRTTNTLYHWAGIIQLLRRVLSFSIDSDAVVDAVNQVCAGLEQVRAGSPAEACLLFPIFTAGCEARGAELRDKFRQRMKDIEGFGLKQVSKAKQLLERSWHGGDNWESLATDEFFG